MAVAPKQIRHKKIGPYRILGELGKGGMAQIYRGLHETLQREVAIKELLPHAKLDPATASRFRREALALAAFRNQHIVTVYDLIDKGDSDFLVLELVDGPTLEELIKGGPIPQIVTAAIGAQLASALEHAHFHKIIHRDLKPANVMLTRSGQVKLMDFGIARDEDLGQLTKTGLVVGTPSYMAPESVLGGKADARTDLHALGVLLYESLAGTRPYAGKSAGEVFARIRDGKHVPLSKAAPHVAGPLRKIVERAMRKLPAERYQDAREIRRELETWIARELEVGSAGLLVAFLRHREKLSETQALERLTARELDVLKHFEADFLEFATGAVEILPDSPPPIPRRRRRKWLKPAAALFTLAAIGGAAGWFHPLWLDQVRALLGQ